MTHEATRTPRLLVAFLAVAATLGPAYAAGGVVGRCVTADIPASVVLPDGSVHPPGVLRVCLEGRRNPAAEYHEIATAKGPEGRFIGARGRAELEIDRPFIVFQRNDNHEWILLGVLQPPSRRGAHATRVRLVDGRRLVELIDEGLARNPPLVRAETRYAALGGTENRVLRLAAR